MIKTKDWWKSYFSDQYLKLYVDIASQSNTSGQVSFLVKNLNLKNKKILDLACGYGRHSIALAKKGYDVTGIDYSKRFIEIAESEALKQKTRATFLAGDIRRLNFKNKFDLVINMFNSFGYFDDESDNLLTLENIIKALKPNGRFFLDLNNTARLFLSVAVKGKLNKKKGLLVTSRKDKLSNGLVVTVKNEFDLINMSCEMIRSWKEKNKNSISRAKIRLYTFPEIKLMLESVGFRVIKVWGDLDGSPFATMSKRMMILAEKY